MTVALETTSSPARSFFLRVAWVFFGALSVFALTSFLSYHLERQLVLRVKKMLQTSVAWARLAEDTEEIEAALEKCLVAGDSESHEIYASLADELRLRAGLLAGDPGLHRDTIAVEDTQGMVETLLAQGSEAWTVQGAQSFEGGNELLHAFSATGEHLRARIHQAVIDLLQQESGDYQLIAARLEVVGRVALLLIVGGLILAILVLAMLSYRLTRPLAELAAAANRVSRGDFSRVIPVRVWDEVGYVAEAFNQMSQNLARLIRDLREKSALEVRLREREVENLAIQNMLQEARLQALQSQISPHFFFNTLNTGVHLAYLEDAERTAAFLETLGRLFRYNLRNPEFLVALEEELNHVGNYVALLHVRLGEDAFSYTTEIEPALLDAMIPRLTLQPLVENAYLHGLAGSTGGHIVVRANRVGADIVIEVEDDGSGIPPQAIQQALRPNGDTAGTRGLANVVARLRLWTGIETPVEIRGGPGRGTVVRLCLPVKD